VQISRSGTSRALMNDELASELGITDEQKKKLETLREELEKETREKIEKIRKEAREKLLGVLTPQQRKQLEKMLGEEFKWEPQQRGGPPGRGQ